MPSLRRRLLRGSVWVFSARVLGIGLSFIVGMILARRLAPVDFGLFLLTLSIIRFAVIIARTGLDRITLRFVSSLLALGRPRDARRTLFATAKLAALSFPATGVVGALFLSLWGRDLLGLPVSMQYIAVCVTLTIALSCLHFMAETFRGFHEIRLASLFDGQNSGPLISLLMILLLWLSNGKHLSLLNSLAFYTAACAAVLPAAGLLLWRTVRVHTTTAWQQTPESPPRDQLRDQPSSKQLQELEVLFSNRLWYQILGLGLPALMLTEAMGYVGNQAPVWMASSYGSGDELSLFIAARQLVHLIAIPMSMLNLAVASTIPELHAQGKGKELQRVLQLTASVGAIPSVVAMILMMLFPKFILAAVFGEFYGGASGFLVIFCLGQIVLMLTGSCDISLILTGNQKPAMINAVVFAAALFVIGCGVAQGYGLVGLAVVSSLVVAASNIALWLIAR